MNCFSFAARLRRKHAALVAVAVIFILAVNVALGYFIFSKDAIPPKFIILSIPGTIALAAVAFIVIQVIKTQFARSNGLPFFHAPIKLLRLGRQLNRSGKIIEFICYHSEYALAYQEANMENGELIVRPTPRIDN